MAAVVRLLTFVDINDRHDLGPEGSRVSVTARHEAVLSDGRHVVLLADRGWTGQVVRSARDGSASVLPSAWAYETAEKIKRTARFVVGPDEPLGGRTQAEMEAGHWDTLARDLQHEGIEVQGADLRELPHDVELSGRVLARLGVTSEGIQ